MKYVCLVLYLQICFKECTIDMNVKELVYIADHLTAESCRYLFASLYFETENLPDDLIEAAEEIPKNIPCIKLLIKWNSGTESWEGQGEAHGFFKRRLYQLDHRDLADWLGKAVFHQLNKELNKSLEEKPQFGAKSATRLKVLKDSDSKFAGEQWSKIDSVLSVALFGIVFITLAAFCRMLKMSFRRAKVRRISPDETLDLLSAGSVESDQEIVYELDVENKKRSRVSFEDPKKSSSEGVK